MLFALGCSHPCSLSGSSYDLWFGSVHRGHMSVRCCPIGAQCCMLGLLGQLEWALAYLFPFGLLGIHGDICIILSILCVCDEVWFVPWLADYLVCLGFMQLGLSLLAFILLPLLFAILVP